MSTFNPLAVNQASVDHIIPVGSCCMTDIVQVFDIQM